MSCGTFELGCHVTEAAAGFFESTLGQMAREAAEAAATAVGSMGSIWVTIDTPNLASGSGSTAVQAGSSASGAGGITTVLGYMQWVGYVVVALSLIAVAVMVAINHRNGDPFFASKKLSIVLGSAVLIGAAGPVAAGLGANPRQASSTVMYLQNNLWWYTIAFAVAGIIVAGIRMAMTQRLDAGREMVTGLVNLIVVTGVGVTALNLLVVAFDSLAERLISGALTCNATADAGCFGTGMVTLLSFTAGAAPGLPAFLLLVLSIVGIFCSAMQIVLMVVRSALLVVFAGLLPTAAAGSSMQSGRAWMNKVLSWTTGWLLYKVIAAFVYAAAFMLTGTPFYTDDGTGWVSSLGGMALMVLALVALPVLVKGVAPAVVGAVSSGGGGGGMGMAAGMGAIAAGAQIYSGSKNGGGGSPAVSPSAKGANASTAPSGSSGQGALPKPGPAASGAGAAASGSAGAATSAGAAGGPAGMAAGAAVDAAAKVGGAVKGAAQGAAQGATDGSGGDQPAGAPSSGGGPSSAGVGSGGRAPTAAGAPGGAGSSAGAVAQGIEAVTAAGTAAANATRRIASTTTNEQE
jgi:hypothetical protein